MMARFDIKVFIKTSLVDWDGKITSVLFTPGCNFRCGFCQNAELVLNYQSMPTIDFEEIKRYLIENRDFIDGVVVTGGEPLIHAWLPDLLRELKSLGFPVKVDTNGSLPDILKKLIELKLVDYVAMDVKAPLEKEKYRDIAGVDVDVNKLKKTIELLMNSGIDYEFRTTVIEGYHSESDIEKIALSIKGARKYALQPFYPREQLIEERFKKYPRTSKEYLEKLKEIASKYVKCVVVRAT